MRQRLISWFLRILERDFPIRKRKGVRLSDRLKAYLAVAAGCILGLALVAFGIVVFTGRWDLYFFLTGLLVAGGLFLVVVIPLALLVMSAVVSWTKDIKTNPFKVEASRNVRLDCSEAEAARRCLAALEQLSQGYERRGGEGTSGEILVKTSMSNKSAGEIISISLVALEDDTTRVAIHSRPWLESTFVDWGVNAENVVTITRYLLRASPSTGSGLEL